MRFTVFTLFVLLMITLATAGEEPREPVVDSLSVVTATPPLPASKSLSEFNRTLNNLYPETVPFARNDIPPAESPATKQDEDNNPARETGKKDGTIQSTIHYLGGLPGEYKLHPAFPDPVTSVIPLRFDVPKLSGREIAVELSIYNTLGEKIYTLFKGELEAGRYEIRWQSRAEDGDPVGPDVYYALFKTEFFQQVMKVTFAE
jgi:hypothetical protein